jgi:mono/diheme cytochrome c family protein
LANRNARNLSVFASSARLAASYSAMPSAAPRGCSSFFLNAAVLATEPNPVSLTDQNLTEGVRLFSVHCTICHGVVAGCLGLACRLPRGGYEALLGQELVAGKPALPFLNPLIYPLMVGLSP